MTKSEYNRDYYERNKERLKQRRRARHRDSSAHTANPGQPIMFSTASDSSKCEPRVQAVQFRQTDEHVQSHIESVQSVELTEESCERLAALFTKALRELMAEIIQMFNQKDEEDAESKGSEHLSLNVSAVAFLSVFVLFEVVTNFFLVKSQTDYYLLKEYSFLYALLAGGLPEWALVMFSVSLGYFKGLWKIPMGVLVGALFCLNVSVITVSVEKQSLAESQGSIQVKNLEKTIARLEADRTRQLPLVESWDVSTHPTKRTEAETKFKAEVSIPLAAAEAKLETLLAAPTTGTGLVAGENNTMRWVRIMLLVCSIAAGALTPWALRRVWVRR